MNYTEVKQIVDEIWEDHVATGEEVIESCERVLVRRFVPTMTVSEQLQAELEPLPIDATIVGKYHVG